MWYDENWVNVVVPKLTCWISVAHISCWPGLAPSFAAHVLLSALGERCGRTSQEQDVMQRMAG